MSNTAENPAMLKPPHSDAQYYLGVDGGGTKCKARLEDTDGNLLGEGLGGPANLASAPQEALDAVETACRQALRNAGLPDSALRQCHAGIGLAGANVDSYRHHLDTWRHPFASMRSATDAQIACLGAHAGADGAILIAGTGFCAAMLQHGQYTEIGGHGLLLGDVGGGARVGLLAVRAAFECLDGVRAASPLVDALLQETQCATTSQLLDQSLHAKPDYFARLAPLVMTYADQNDPIARDIVLQVAADISRYAEYLLSFSTPSLSMVGGLSASIEPWLTDTVRKRLCPPKASPEAGAVYLARQ